MARASKCLVLEHNLLLTGKVTLNSVVRSGWEVGNTGTASLSDGAGSDFLGLLPVW